MTLNFDKFCINEIDKQIEEICTKRGYVFSVMFLPPNNQFDYFRYMIWFSPTGEFEEIEFDEFHSLAESKIDFLKYLLKSEKKLLQADYKKKKPFTKEVFETVLKAVTKPIKEKNPNAVALGKLGGLKGGKARAEKLTPGKRKEIAKKGAEARWSKKINYEDMA